MDLIIILVLVVLFAGAGVAIWLALRAQKTQPPSNEGDTGWNDRVSPGDQATKPTDD